MLVFLVMERMGRYFCLSSSHDLRLYHGIGAPCLFWGEGNERGRMQSTGQGVGVLTVSLASRPKENTGVPAQK